tara:strand:+ start:39 stop:512 length:474 start_codon:yes stop_codon:yes gene_type:complete
MAIPQYGLNREGGKLDHAGHSTKVITSNYTLVASDSGSTIIIGLNAGITIKLPTPEDGMNFTFYYGANAAETEDVVVDTQSNSYYLNGGLTIHDTDATTANAEILVAIAPNGSSNSKMTLKDPSLGTWMRMVTDGTLWYCVGLIASATATAVVYADQ